MKIRFGLVLCVVLGFGAVQSGWAAAAKPTKEEVRRQEAEIKAARIEAKAEARAKAEADAKSRAEARTKEKAEREEKAKAAAKLEAAQEDAQTHWGPYFIGYESEPSMDAGGMLVTTVHRGISDVGERWTRRFPYVRFPYELLFAIGLSTVQHEVFGHGARGREYNLNPSYGFGLDFSGYTEVKKEPANNLDLAALCAGGTEADMVMARRILLDSCQPGGSPASSTFLMFFGKVDVSVYVLSTSKPKPGRAGGGQESTFTDEYEGGNDIAIYLATRQAQRVGAAPRDVWNRDYQLDFDDPLLRDTYDQAHDMAIWNLVDPMMWGSLVLYVKDHLIQGKRVATAPAIPLGGDFGLTVGTRGALGPDAISRFLDVYLLTPRGVFSVYGRDIRAADDATMGFGAGLYRMPAGPVKLSASADFWSNPEAPEGFYDDDSGWNVCGEAEIHVADPLSLWLKAGHKSDGFFPGTPTDSGPYVGGGVLLAF